MTILEYPYAIIVILSAIFVLMVVLGLYFTVKSVKAADGTAEKDFCGMGKLERDFKRSGQRRKRRSVIYISIFLDSMKKLHSESKAERMYAQIKRILFEHLSLDIGGELALCGNGNFVALNYSEPGETELCIERCFKEINEVFAEHGAVNVTRLYFGYICTASNELLFETALERAKKASSMAEDKEVICCRWDSSSEREFEKKLKIENSIQNEIESDRFFLEYQPILNAKTGKLFGAEVLSRLNSQTEGILASRFFLPAVRNVGLSREFDYYIFEKNCKWISNDKEKRVGYVYSVNFSRYTLCEKNMAEKIFDIIKKYDIDCSCIAVEILEDKSSSDAERAEIAANLSCLAEKGILILLDDFGKGYTGFDDLKDFDVSIVKIDKAITQNATTQKGFLILKNIIKIAHDLGSLTLCEGIETEAHKSAAEDAGCDMFQGYYFYKPMPVGGLEKLFDKK